jgi:hypothetical protein
VTGQEDAIGNRGHCRAVSDSGTTATGRLLRRNKFRVYLTIKTTLISSGAFAPGRRFAA